MPKAYNLPVFLSAKREATGLSQKEVADRLGYATSQFVSNWERGQAQPPVDILRKLCAIYKISPDEMFQHILSTKVEQLKGNLERKFYGRRLR